MKKTESKKEKINKETFGRNMKSVVIRPWVSEKSQRALEANQYVFLVDIKANKNIIKQEIRRRYNVHVTDVNITRIPGDIKRFKRSISRKQDMKKAIVFLKKGEKIDIG